jgi:hypothetical protein
MDLFFVSRRKLLGPTLIRIDSLWLKVEHGGFPLTN